MGVERAEFDPALSSPNFRLDRYHASSFRSGVFAKEVPKVCREMFWNESWLIQETALSSMRELRLRWHQRFLLFRDRIFLWPTESD